jgi:hypothetical protein
MHAGRCAALSAELEQYRFRYTYQLEAGVQAHDGLAGGLRDNGGAREAERGRDP